jgi:hypothetical protein
MLTLWVSVSYDSGADRLDHLPRRNSARLPNRPFYCRISSGDAYADETLTRSRDHAS